MKHGLIIVVAIVVAEAAWACPLDNGPIVGSFTPPVDGDIVSGFGMRLDRITNKQAFHPGVDYAAALGEPVRAAHAGEVLIAEMSSDRGGYVTLRHAEGLETGYRWLSEVVVRMGDCVTGGAFIGKAGATESGPHVHFELLLHGRLLDPARSKVMNRKAP
jgi:murein DD-endopeptidase MepM/ murein hydrolase activator NlpD